MKKNQHQEDINNLNYDYLELFEIGDDKKMYDELVSEILLDALDLKLSRNREELYLYYYLSKYSIFIYHFEAREKYEYCAEIKRMGVALISDSFSIPRVEVSKMFELSIKSFREQINEK